MEQFDNKDFQEVFLNLISSADDYYSRGNFTAQRDIQNQNLIEMLSRVNFGIDLFAGHQMYMQSGFNNFLTLRLAMLPKPLIDSSNEKVVNLNITINGFASLLRQSIECLVRSLWLLDCRTKFEISERGFAVLWENATNRLKYEKSLQSPRVTEFEEILSNLRQEGIDTGLFKACAPNCSKFADNPRIQIQDASGLLRNVTTTLELPKELLEFRGEGFRNAEWVYRWLSGLTHGLDWAHNSASLPQNFEFGLVIRRPDIERFTLAAHYILLISHKLFELTDGLFEKKLSAIAKIDDKRQ